MVVLGSEVLEMYDRFTLYNSPYISHDEGCAIDLYPPGNPSNDHERVKRAPSPVSGEVIETLEVSAPKRDYAVPRDYLILVDTGGLVARILHVNPEVDVGDQVERRDNLGKLVRSGHFAQWVGNHIHLGFREPDSNLRRASGSLRVEIDTEILGVEWEGTGKVVETGETYAVLNEPQHPEPGKFAGIKARSGDSTEGVIDGGVPHYPGGGLLNSDENTEGTVEVSGLELGTARGRNVEWHNLNIYANRKEITGLSFFVSRTEFGAKLICPDVSFEKGEEVNVEIHLG